MIDLINKTSYVVRLLVFPNIEGVESAIVIIQATFNLRGGDVSQSQAPLVEADVYVDNTGVSPLREASDFTLEKLGTDVLLDGVAYAPLGVATPHFVASFSVGSVTKHISVVGDRQWQRTWLGIRATHPLPVLTVPLTWTEAIGGTNLPRLEHPECPVHRPRQRPPPWGGCGPISPTWSSRSRYAGTYDQAWKRARAPYLPSDFSALFFQSAPEDQVYQGYLQGGEDIVLQNCSRENTVRATVPRCLVRASFWVRGSETKPPLHLDTIRLLPEINEMRLIWRAVVPLGRRMIELKRVEVSHGT